MAATTDSSIVTAMADRLILDVQFSAINNSETFTYTFPSSLPAMNPYKVQFTTTTLSTSGDPVNGAWTGNSVLGVANSTRALSINMKAANGGVTTSAIVRMQVEWRESAAGGITA